MLTVGNRWPTSDGKTIVVLGFGCKFRRDVIFINLSFIVSIYYE
jgi:hypothetical protein